jgi:hypothetical protein
VLAASALDRILIKLSAQNLDSDYKMSWDTGATNGNNDDGWGSGGAAATVGFDDFGATDFGNGDARGGNFNANDFDNGDARGGGNGGCFNCGEDGYVYVLLVLISTDTS